MAIYFLVLAGILTKSVYSLFNDSILQFDLNSSTYQTEFNKLVGLGYQLISVNGYTLNNVVKYATIWDKKAGVPWIAKHHMSASEFQDTINNQTSTKYRLKFISAYAVNNTPYFSTIWHELGGEVPLVDFGMTLFEYQNKLNSLKFKGYRLSFLYVYTIDRTEHYVTIFDKSTVLDWHAEHRIPAKKYKSKLDKMHFLGYELVSVSGYAKKFLFFGEIEYYAALWIKSSSSISTVWAENHDIKAYFYSNVFYNRRYQGFKPKYMNIFVSGSSVKVSSIWINPVMKGEDLKILDNAVDAYMKEQNVTGLSFAVSKDERLVFAKAYGLADSLINEPLSPTHSMRIMSVSKTVTGLGVMKLLEKGLLKSLNMKVFGNSSVFGSKYPFPAYNTVNLNKVTVKQLLNHTAGLKTCFLEDVLFSKTSTHMDAMMKFLNDKDLFLHTPGKEFYYSNLGYLFLGRIIEHLSNMSYEQFIRENVLNPCQIGSSMYVGKADGTPVRPIEANYYPPLNINLQMFDAFGGWVARPIDLVKLMVKIDGLSNKPDIFSSYNLNELKSTSSFYGLGIIVLGSEYGHNGSGITSRALLWKANNGISYAVTVNSQPKDDIVVWNLKKRLQNAIETVSVWPPHDLF